MVRTFARPHPETWTARQPETSLADLLEHKSVDIIHQLQAAVNNLFVSVAHKPVGKAKLPMETASTSSPCQTWKLVSVPE